MAAINEQIAGLEETDRNAQLQLEIARLREQLRRRGSAVRLAAKQIEELQQQVRLTEAFATATPRPPKWVSEKKALKINTATVCAMLSDTHLDEVVNPAEVNGLNAYSREIALKRLQRWARKLIEIPRYQFGGTSYDGLVVFLGGDMISGDIHDELRETNEDTVLGTCIYWSEQLAAALGLLSEAYDKVHVVSVCGNHGRRTRKERAKLRARDSFDFLLSHMTRRALRADNVTWQIPEETDARVRVQNTRYLLTHGNLGFGGGGGIAGAWTPIVRGDLKRRQREGVAGDPYDVLLVGHWHTLRFGGEFVINGSLKGTDEYAYSRSFGLEPPKQAMWLETPDYGPFGYTPIFCAPMLPDGRIDRKKEGW